jgi:hypothetical protein
MEFYDSILFVFFILILLWVIKADFFFLIFGIAAFLYFLILLFAENPLIIIVSTLQFIISNPLGIILIFIPLFLYVIMKIIRRSSYFNKN